MSTRRVLSVLAVLLPSAASAGALGAAPAGWDDAVAPAPGTIAPVIDAFDGTLVWSQLGAGTDPGTSYFLHARVDGVTRQLPVAPRQVPFDVDLGPDGEGGVVAVYSRCADEPTPQRVSRSAALHSRPYPAWTAGGDCDLFRYSFSRGRETKIAGVSMRGASESLPSIWNGRLAFVRVYEQRTGRPGRLPHLYVRSETGALTRLAGGRRATSGLSGPTRLDLYGRRLSFVWNASTSAASGGTRGTSELRLTTVGGRSEVLSQARWGTPADPGYASYVGPQGDDGRITYGFQRGLYGEAEATNLTSLLFSRRAVGGPSSVSPAPPFLVDTSTDRGQTFAGIDEFAFDTLGRSARIVSRP